MVIFMKKIDAHNLINQTGFGLTAAGSIGLYCLCLSAALNQGVFVALIGIILFTVFSIEKDYIYTPSPLFAVIFFFLLQFNSFAGAVISLALGGYICLILNKLTKGKKLPDFVSGGCFIGLALCATILFTNTYFGIGASGFTPLEMLESYRSLGFHPDFRGLLYGTITLFTMITYPFKFRKLKNIIPAEFITVAIPFVLNLILNPNSEHTTTNEYSMVDFNSNMFDYTDISVVWGLISTGIATGFILYALLQNHQVNKQYGFFAVQPTIPCGTRHYKIIAPLVTIIISTAIILLCPSLISRLPLPCAGAMLIVSAWQQTSFKPLSATLKQKSVFKLLLLILCSASFVILPVFFAVILCVFLWVVTELFNRRKGEKL